MNFQFLILSFLTFHLCNNIIYLLQLNRKIPISSIFFILFYALLFLYSFQLFLRKICIFLQCSKSCGDGFKRRAVTCHAFNAYGWMYPEPADTSLCDSSLRPRDTERCNYGDCSSGYVWRPEPWQAVCCICYFKDVHNFVFIRWIA